MKYWLSFFASCSLLAMSILPAASVADIDSKKARMLQQQGDILPLEHIIESALKIKEGQVVETELDRDDGRYVYELDILDKQGQVWEIELDASTAELLELENED